MAAQAVKTAMVSPPGDRPRRAHTLRVGGVVVVVVGGGRLGEIGGNWEKCTAYCMSGGLRYSTILLPRRMSAYRMNLRQIRVSDWG